MASIVLPSTKPSGDDQQWKREVEETLRQLRDAIEAATSQIGKR